MMKREECRERDEVVKRGGSFFYSQQQQEEQEEERKELEAKACNTEKTKRKKKEKRERKEKENRSFIKCKAHFRGSATRTPEKENT